MFDLTLLYAEDDPETRENYLFVLCRHFARVLGAADGAEALRLYESEAPDILLLDIAMPGIDGLELTRRIRQRDPQVPIVILTAHSEKERLIEAIPLGLSHYLLKPVDSAELLGTLGSIAQTLREGRPLELACGCRWESGEEELRHGGEPIPLSRQERRLMKLLCRRAGSFVDRERIVAELWEETDPSVDYENKLIQLVYRLNRKVAERSHSDQRLVQNSYAHGYRVVPSEESRSKK
ncbi:response regulator transcription factor [Nitratifractor sp.]